MSVPVRLTDRGCQKFQQYDGLSVKGEIVTTERLERCDGRGAFWRVDQLLPVAEGHHAG